MSVNNNIVEKDLIPWQGLALTCVRILQLYEKVFGKSYTAQIPRYNLKIFNFIPKEF